MRSLFIHIGSRFNQMPFGVRLLIALCMFAPIFGLVLHFKSADDPQNYASLPRLSLITICSAVFIYGLLQATHWSRPLLVICLAGSSIGAIFQHRVMYLFSDYLDMLVTDGFIVWILYFQRGVRDYYAKTQTR
jgi:hypothetical protein